MTHPHARILIFAKAPVPGACKTRLAAGVGAPRAARVYHSMLAAVTAGAAEAELAPVSLWCTPGTGHAAFHRLRARYNVALRRQPSGELGRRMHGALASALRGAQYAVLVGSDCPFLAPSHLETALAHLRAGDDAVFAPTRDGGYALVGMRRPEPRLFRGLHWSTPGVMPGTRRRLRRLEWTWSELATVSDVDERGDFVRARRAGLL